MPFFPSLEIGKRALLAQQLGLDTTSNNVANVNTPGYSRRRIELVETEPVKLAAGTIGTGVRAGRIVRLQHEFFDKEIRNSIATKKYNETHIFTFQRLEAILGEGSDTGLDRYIQRFFDSLNDLALEPESLQRREAVLSTATSMINAFRTTGQKIRVLREDIKSKAETRVATINKLLEQIASLNAKIGIESIEGTGATAPLEDQRTKLLEQLAEYLNIDVRYDNNNMVNIAVSGSTILTGPNAHTLELKETIDSATQERTLALNIVDTQGNAILQLHPTAGEIAGLLEHYNVLLDDKDSSNGFSIAKQLNRLVEALVTRINAISVTGYGLDDTGTAPPGRNFFDPAGTTLETIALDAAIASSPRDIPTSSAAGEPGNNAVALQMADVINDENFLDNTTLMDFYTNLIGKLGLAGQNAKLGFDTAKAVESQMITQREAMAGVNLDEEAVQLVKFQKAYQAAARIVSVANELLDTLVRLGQ